MKTPIGLAVAFAVILGSAVQSAAAPAAPPSIVRMMIAGALSSPSGPTQDGQITLRVGVGLPVSLVSNDAVVPGPIGAATVARWSDTTPSPGFASPADLMVIRLGGLMVTAAGINTPGGLLTTFSASGAGEGLSGTWTMVGGATSGVTGAGAGDAVVTFVFEFDPLNTVLARLVLGNVLVSGSTKSVPGIASVFVNRNVPVLAVVDDAVAAQIGTMTNYQVFGIAGHGTEFAGLTALNFGGVYVLYACAFPDAASGIACLVGGAGPLAPLSGHATETAAQFVTGITGLNIYDQLLRLFVSLP